MSSRLRLLPILRRLYDLRTTPTTLSTSFVHLKNCFRCRLTTEVSFSTFTLLRAHMHIGRVVCHKIFCSLGQNPLVLRIVRSEERRRKKTSKTFRFELRLEICIATKMISQTHAHRSITFWITAFSVVISVSGKSLLNFINIFLRVPSPLLVCCKQLDVQNERELKLMFIHVHRA